MIGINSFPASSHVRRPVMRPLENPRLFHVLDGNCMQGLLKRFRLLKGLVLHNAQSGTRQ